MDRLLRERWRNWWRIVGSLPHLVPVIDPCHSEMAENMLDFDYSISIITINDDWKNDRI